MGTMVAEMVGSFVKPLVSRVWGIISHHEIHDDELMARWLLRTFGTELLPGVERAPLQLVDSGIRSLRGKSGDEWFAAGYLCLGTCGGPLDEHALPPEERARASAATLAAKMLRVESFAPVKAMLAHAVRVDRTPTASAYDISSVIKAMHRDGVRIADVCRSYDRLAGAWFTTLCGRVRNPQWREQPNFDRIAAEWIVARIAPDNFDRSRSFATAYEAADAAGLMGIRSLRPLLNYLLAEEKRALLNAPLSERMFEMSGAVDALNMDNASTTFVREFVFAALAAKWTEQGRFMKAYDELDARRVSDKLYVTGTPLRVVYARSDNPEMNRAMRAIDAQCVFVQRGTDGHVVIWYNKMAFNMDAVIARLRSGDCRARQAWQPSQKRLVSEGTLPEAPCWYYNPTSGQIMNGSRTNRGTPVTKLDDNTIVHSILQGLKATK